MSILKTLSALLLCFIVMSAPATHAQEVRIAAVVNDDIISLADLDARIRLVLASSNIPDSPDMRKRVSAQVMRTLIDEKLEMQEAKKLNVSVSDKEVDDQLKHLEQANGMPSGGLDRFLREKGIERTTLAQQITTQMTWQRLVRRRMGINVGVGEEEITDELKRIEVNRDKPQNRVAEIYLSVDSSDQDADVQRTAQHLVDELRQGADFALVAKQFSQSATAAVGGDIGWIQAGTLDPRADEIIQGLKPSQMAGPVRLTGGYYIYLLIDRRAGSSDQSNVVVNLTQVVFPLSEGADPATREAVVQRARQATAGAKSCGELNKIGQEVAPGTSGEIGRVRIADLPAELRPTLATVKIAEPTAPLPVRGGIGVLMVCDREGGEDQATREQVFDTLQRQRFQNLERRYIRDLRRVAFIDLRM